MKVLVTGGCGFIGSNLVHELSRKGWIVDVVDDLSNGSPYFLRDLPTRYVPDFSMTASVVKQRTPDQVLVFTVDFANPGILSLVRQGEYDYIFHLAANPRVEYSVKFPTLTTEQNLLRTVGLFECASKGSVKKVIFSSTCAVYGDATHLPTSEDAPTNPNSPYGLQKITCEKFARMMANSHGLETVCLRYFNVYGPRQFGGSPYSTAITSWTHNAYAGRPLRSDGDGTQSRDLVYVGDVVDANIKAALSQKKFGGCAYNIGTGVRLTNNDLLSKFKKKFLDVEVENAPWRPGDVMHTEACVANAKKDFSFSAKTTIDEGLKQTWEWWEKAKVDNEL